MTLSWAAGCEKLLKWSEQYSVSKVKMVANSFSVTPRQECFRSVMVWCLVKDFGRSSMSHMMEKSSLLPYCAINQVKTAS